MAEIDADIARQADDLPTIPLPGLVDEDGNEMQVHVKEVTEGQGLMAMRLLHQMTDKRSSSDDSAKAARRILDLLLSVIPIEEEQEAVEDALTVGKIDLEDLMAVFETGVEEMAGRPTKSSTGSSDRRPASGRSSQVKSQRRVSPSKRSPSRASAT